MGEGISAGMESGYCVAQAVANHFDALDMIYADYQQDTQQLKSYMERQWNFTDLQAMVFLHVRDKPMIEMLNFAGILDRNSQHQHFIFHVEPCVILGGFTSCW